MSEWWKQWSPDQVTVADKVPDNAWKVCVMRGVYFGKNKYNGSLGGRISSIFVILVTSLFATAFPVIAKRVKRLHIPEVVYMIARMFGSGVIISTAFVHLMHPSFNQIGGTSCVGMTGHWGDYSWNAGIMLAGAVFTFIIDAYCAFFAEAWFGVRSNLDSIPSIHNHSDRPELDDTSVHDTHGEKNDSGEDVKSVETQKLDYYAQFAGFLVLEFGIIFHSVMVGLTLGASDEYATLYPVLVFHQAFEGLGIGTRLCQIPFPKHRRWIPYFCCLAYGLTTPISIAIGLGVRTAYHSKSFTAQIVQGVLNSISAGILLYTGFVELLARDFVFNPRRTKKLWYLSLQLFVFLWGAGLMSLLGKWA